MTTTTMMMMGPKQHNLRWVVAWFIACVLLGNHFARDAPGSVERYLTAEPALEKEAHKARVHMSPAQFSATTSAFFVPAIVCPLAAAVATKHVRGGAKTVWMVAVVVCLVGHATAAAAYAARSVVGVVTGRMIAGSAYEIVDMLFVGFVAPLYVDDGDSGRWGTASGIINGTTRLGSVAVFACAPAIVDVAGAGGVFYAACAAFIVATGFACATMPAVSAAQAHQDALSNDKRSAVDGDDDDDEQEGERLLRIAPANDIDQKAQASASSSVVDDVRSLSMSWWLFCASGFALYASVVPFWFLGKHLLETRGNVSARNAGMLMVVPEGAICLVSMPVGLLVDRWRLSFQARMGIFAGACVALSLAFVSFDVAPHAPIPSVLLLGISYATANALLWASFTDAATSDNLSLAAGILASLLNFGAAAIPGAIALIRASVTSAEMADSLALRLLGVCSLSGALFALATASRHRRAAASASEARTRHDDAVNLQEL